MPEGSLLIVEDDPEMRAVLRLGFEQAGFAVHAASDGAQALEGARNAKFEAIILDAMLPVLDGYAFARKLRDDGDRTPILMLTARDTMDDMVRGFDCGADDYLKKPFSFVELTVRVRALMRRASPAGARLRFADLTMDVSARQVSREGRGIHLSRTEFQLLETLLRHSGHVVSRRDLVREAWGENVNIEENTLDVTVSSLRGKVEAPDLPRLIHTARGFGYRLGIVE